MEMLIYPDLLLLAHHKKFQFGKVDNHLWKALIKNQSLTSVYKIMQSEVVAHSIIKAHLELP